MQNFLAKGIFLSLILIISAFTIFSINEINGQEKLVEATSIGFEETTIIEFKNNGKSEIQSFRLWLGTDNSFKSFKTEQGWTGKKTPQGVIVFTTSDPIKPGQSVKFGLKTDKTKPGINWKAIDNNDVELEIGKTLVTGSPSKPTIKDNNGPTVVENNGGILSDSSFRLIPEKPNVGGTIRATGDNFASNQEFNFYIDNTFLDSFETDTNGHFMLTAKLPENIKADRVDFFVKDNDGNEKSLSLRLGETPSRAEPETIPLTIGGLPNVINPGDVILILGTGNPSGTVTSKVTDSEGNVLTTNAVPVDNQGKWSFETLVPVNTPLGKYSAEISDGKETLVKTWNVELAEGINIVPSKIKYDAGELFIFNGTAAPNQNVEIILENPQGAEIFSDIILTDDSGLFYFVFQSEPSLVDGTYALFGFQGDKSEIVYIGVGQLPKAQLVAKMDKLNYKSGDTAILSIRGPESTPKILVIDPSDKTMFEEQIILGADGKIDYEFVLTDYASGIYTAVISFANLQTSEVFSVGLQVSSAPIDVRITKETYEPGEPILILGEYPSNILITLSLFDPEGKEIKMKETFSDKNGVLSESSFRVPADAESGVWKIKATSGPHFSEAEFDVQAIQEGMIVFVQGIDTIPGIGEIVNIRILGAAQSVVIDIFSEDEELVGHLEFVATDAGEVSTPWPVPKDLPPGTYTIKASDQFNSAETSFILD